MHSMQASTGQRPILQRTRQPRSSACSSSVRTPARAAPCRHRRSPTCLAQPDGSSGNGSGPLESDDDGASSSSGAKFLRFNKDLPKTHHNPEAADHLQSSELPEHLRDLALGPDGRLVDGKTGKVVNGLGATRLDVKLAALRGDLDPKPWEQNTERAPGVLLQSLVSFPADYSFSVVGADAGGCPKGEHREFVEFVLATVSRIAEVPLPLPEGAVTRKPRMNGKFVSLGITVNVRAPEIVMSVCAELQKDPRVKMSF